ncbi:hypothetical protein NC651_017534 [Populus alba x Populus x berolinensis]|nr:hypothetical protein NC651_017534 [Populus alba x Populus x berolinensis]
MARIAFLENMPEKYLQVASLATMASQLSEAGERRVVTLLVCETLRTKYASMARKLQKPASILLSDIYLPKEFQSVFDFTNLLNFMSVLIYGQIHKLRSRGTELLKEQKIDEKQAVAIAFATSALGEYRMRYSTFHSFSSSYVLHLCLLILKVEEFSLATTFCHYTRLLQPILASTVHSCDIRNGFPITCECSKVKASMLVSSGSVPVGHLSNEEIAQSLGANWKTHWRWKRKSSSVACFQFKWRVGRNHGKLSEWIKHTVMKQS